MLNLIDIYVLTTIYRLLIQRVFKYANNMDTEYCVLLIDTHLKTILHVAIHLIVLEKGHILCQKGKFQFFYILYHLNSHNKRMLYKT